MCDCYSILKLLGFISFLSYGHFKANTATKSVLEQFRGFYEDFHNFLLNIRHMLKSKLWRFIALSQIHLEYFLMGWY